MRGYLKTQDSREYPVEGVGAPIECSRCGICCTCYQPKLTPREVKATARGLRVTEKEFVSLYVQVTVIGYLLKQSKGGCIFLNREEDDRAGCAIYSFRPAACRHWVPSLSHRECREGLNRLKPRNRMMLAEELYSSPEAREQFYASLKTGEDAVCPTE